MKKLKIGIFGGSFNPPHLGHLNVIKMVAENTKIKLNEIWVVPEHSHRFKSISTNYSYILQMCHLSFPINEEINGIAIRIFDNDQYKKTNGSMFKLLQLLKKEFHNAEFYIIVGSDIIFELSKWHNYKKLIKEEHFIFVERTRTDWLNYNFGGFEDKFFKKNDFIFLDNPSGINISSTEIRNNIHSLNPDVIRFIYENNLYR
ncbi:MAG: nicotinate-nicotinamide nucleotide adenylyltransferase [Candidatus Nanoarchaeia archaeon]|nr:nicotinate-nicotinamide nucleotide adenylyltransferase [Candidatus Nanoarchaeia archaeon]